MNEFKYVESQIDRTPYGKEQVLAMYERMLLIRLFEERVKMLFLEGNMPGTIHQCQGQEATAVGVAFALREGDMLTSTHRPHGHALAKGLSSEEVLAELYGKTTGCCKGKGGSMHLGNMDKGMVPAIAIVAGGIPVATGIALSYKLRKQANVAACFFGDGAVNEGAFHEALNMASIWDLPVIYACENNLYGASTHIKDTMNVATVAERASAYGMRGETINGNDVLAVYEATMRAAEECREGKGPVLLEFMTYRRTGHSRRDPCHYQESEEQKFWMDHDPIVLCRQELEKRLGAGATEIDTIETRLEAEIEKALVAAQNAPEPELDDILDDVLA